MKATCLKSDLCAATQWKIRNIGKVGDDLIEAFQEMLADLRGNAKAESYEIPDNVLMPRKVSETRRRPMSSRR